MSNLIPSDTSPRNIYTGTPGSLHQSGQNMIQPLLDRSDAAGIFTADDIFDLTRKFQRFF